MPHSTFEGSPTVAHFATCTLCDRHLLAPYRVELSTAPPRAPFTRKASGAVVNSRCRHSVWMLYLRMSHLMQRTGFLPNSPQKTSQFTGNGRAGLHLEFAPGIQGSIAGTEPLLCTPCNVLNHLWCLFRAPLQRIGLACHMTIGPRGFNQHS